MAEHFGDPVGPDGLLTKEALDLVAANLRDKFKNACPSCSERNFLVADRIYAAPAVGQGRSINAANSYPQVIVQCMNCGHTIPFAARLVGLYKPGS